MVDRTQLLLSTLDKTDQVIKILSGSFNVPAFDVGSTTIGTGVPAPTFYQGIYTIGASSDYGTIGFEQDFGTAPVIFSVVARTSANSFYIQAFSNSGSDQTVNFQVALIATPTQGLVDISNIGTKTYFDTRTNNYQKVAFDDSATLTLAAGSIPSPTVTTIPVPHNLGYVPVVRAYLGNGTSLTDAMTQFCISMLGGSLQGALPHRIDTSNVNFDFYNETTQAIYTLYYRIYYDPA